MGLIDIAMVILPVFGLIGMGFLARLTGYLPESVGEGVSRYVFSFAVPCLLFRTMIDGHLPAILPWAYWATSFFGVAVAWVGAMALIMGWLGRDARTGVVAGFTAAQANTVFVGIPLILAVYGETGAAPLVALIAVHLPLMMLVAAVLMELAAPERRGWRATAQQVARNIAINPIVVAIVAGSLWRALGLPAEGLARPILDGLSQTAGPCALFALGIALRRYGIAGDLRAILSLTSLKLIVHPGAVFLIGHYVFALPPVWLGAAVLFACSPSGINAYLLAGHYKTGLRMSSSTIAVSTALAVLSCAVWLLLLPPLHAG